MKRRPLYSRSGKLRRIGEATLLAPLASAIADHSSPKSPGLSLSERNRRHWQRAYRRHQGKILVLASVVMTFIVLGAYDAIKGPNLPLTADEFVEVVNGIVQNQPRPRAQTALAYEAIIPSVVAVSGYDPEAWKRLPPMPPDERPGIKYTVIGTGTVVDADGTILTNLHVVRAMPDIRVTFMDGTIADARLIGSQPANDLAVLQPSKLPAELKPATLSSAATLSPGDQVVSASGDRNIHQHNAADGAELRQMAGHADWVYTLSAHPVLKRIASGSYDGEIRIWNSEDGTMTTSFIAIPKLVPEHPVAAQ